MNPLKEQKSGNNKIETFIPVFVAENEQGIALDLVAWFRKNKMAPGWSGVSNAWNANCKGKAICKISLLNDGWSADNHSTWNVLLYLENIHEYEDSIIREELQEIILSRISKCTYCLSGTKHCAGGFVKTVLGKEYKGICYSYCYPMIYDPDTAMIDNIQKLIGMEQKARVNKPALPLPTPSVETTLSPLTANYTRLDNLKCVSGISGKTKSINKIFDGTYDDDYGSRNSSDVQFQLDKPETLRMYGIVTGESKDLPVEWTLYGYDDESGQWAELDKQARTSITPIAMHTEYAFEIATPGKHQQYKLNIKSKGYVQFTQLHLYV